VELLGPLELLAEPRLQDRGPVLLFAELAVLECRLQLVVVVPVLQHLHVLRLTRERQLRVVPRGDELRERDRVRVEARRLVPGDGPHGEAAQHEQHDGGAAEQR
jgi:hypothetical protein